MLNFLRPAQASAPHLTMADVIAKAQKGEITLVDVRERGELAASGTAKGAIHVPVSFITMKADPKSPDFDKRFDAKKPVALFCASGARSGMATQALQRLGYEAMNLGGFGNWVSAGGPVQRV